MKHHQQRQADALRRVQDFLEANADAVKPLGDSEGRKQLSAAITRVGVLANDQGSAELQLAGEISRCGRHDADRAVTRSSARAEIIPPERSGPIGIPQERTERRDLLSLIRSQSAEQDR